MNWRSCAVLALLLLPCVSWAQEPEAPDKTPKQPSSTNPTALPLDPEGVGATIESEVFVGDRAPDFELEGSQGRPVRLADLKGRWAVMVFEKSRLRLGPLKEIDADLRKLGARLYGITKDGVPALSSYAEREQLLFVLLSDWTGQISQLYGMYDAGTDAIQPGLILLDPQGVVRMTLLGQSLHAGEVLQLVKHSLTGS
jgi:peroxiredoxin